MAFVVDGEIGRINAGFVGVATYPSHFIPPPQIHAVLPVSASTSLNYIPPVTGLQVGDFVVVQWGAVSTGSGTTYRYIATPSFTSRGNDYAGKLHMLTQYKRMTAADVASAATGWNLLKSGPGTFVQSGNWTVIRGTTSATVDAGTYGISSTSTTSATPNSGGLDLQPAFLRVNCLWLYDATSGVQYPYTTAPSDSYLAGAGLVSDGTGAAGQLYIAMTVGDVAAGGVTSWNGWTFPSNAVATVGLAFTVQEAGEGLPFYQPTDHLTDLYSLQPGAADTRISLTSPTQLSFGTITWKLRFIHVWEGENMYGLDGYAVQPDDLIGVPGGYQTGAYPWYTKPVEGTTEGYEVHGSVGAAWWQLIFLGNGQAILTNGETQATVDVVADAWYTITMGISGSVSTLIMRDADDVAVSETIGATYDAAIVLDESIVGASGARFAPYGSERTQLLSEFTDYSVSNGDVYGQHHTYDGGVDVNGFWTGVTADAKTGDVGTTASTDAVPHTQRPAYSTCTGLDYTFQNARHTEKWWVVTISEMPPEWAGYLQVRATGIQDKLGAASKEIWLDYKDSAPTRMWDGVVAGEVGVPGSPNQTTLIGHVPVEALNDDGSIWLGLMTHTKAYVGIVDCGNAFQDPYRTGEWNTHRIYFDDAEDWVFAWAAATPPDALAVDFDFIALDGMSVGGDVIFEDGEGEVSAGWNTEVVAVTGGLFSIGATPSAGSVNIYDSEGELLEYGVDWEEVDDLGLDYRILVGTHVFVTVVYFVTEGMSLDSLPVSRPDQDELEVNVALGPRTRY